MSIYRGRTTREIYLANLLYDAIDDEDINSVNTILAKGADPNLVLPKRGISPFHLAVGKETEEFAVNVTTLLLQNAADPNIRTDDGLTPLHIAAAFGRTKILHSLLCCGGNPDFRDTNYKKSIDYAQEYEHKECVDLLLSFMEKQNIFNKDELNTSFNITLEKIVVENSGHTGEYEIVHEYKTEPLTKQNLESLHQLPETDTTEYVMNWCQNNIQNVTPPVLVENTVNSSENSANISDFRESSCDESDGGKCVNYNINDEKITFRKKYTKIRKVSSSKRSSKARGFTEPIQSPVCNSTIVENTNTNEMFKTLKDFSEESGIMTLPNSGTDLYVTDNKQIDASLTNPQQQSPQVENIISSNENTMANSSDYRTCSPCNHSGNHLVSNSSNRQLLDITNDLSRLNVEETKSRRSSTKSEGVFSTDVSFISVSEVYKYIDEDEGVVLYEKRFLKTGTSDYAGSIKSSFSSIPTSVDYDTDTLRKELTSHGYNPGPITFTTKRIYLRKLKQIKKKPLQLPIDEPNKKIYSVELERTLRDTNWLKDTSVYKSLEEVIVKEFGNPNRSRRWREGINKTSFTYLLLDPRKTNNLPCRAETMDTLESWQVFLSSIFYVGKGKRSRPYSHLYEAVRLWKDGFRSSPNKKLNQILDIWNENNGVICLHIFQNVIPVEAYTREAAIISALKLENLRNIKGGEFYGMASTWTQRQKKMLGVHLLYKAMMIFLHEGERQLCPADIE